MLADIDCRYLFAMTLSDMIEEIFPEHGVSFLYEDEITEITREMYDRHYQATVRELRTETGLRLVDMPFGSQIGGKACQGEFPRGAIGIGRCTTGESSTKSRTRRRRSR